jgi:acetoin utilization deacetylase AcuC-like enzyme
MHCRSPALTAPTNMPLAIISHPDCRLHDPGPLLPDRPERLDAIQDRLIASGLDFVCRHYDAPLAEREQLVRAHDPEYVDQIFRLSPGEGQVEIDGDTVMTPHTLQAARRAAGAAVMAVDLVMTGEASTAFCAVRPPGHHAARGRAMGFCLFNNVAVGACHAMAHHGIERIAIVDFDVHHGNGTEDIFRGDDRVLFCSSFQHPFYPYSSHQAATPRLVPISLPAGSGGPLFRQKISERWLPALEAFKPELLLVSAGFDGHILDDMSDLALRESDFEWVTECILRVARRHARGRLVSVLEGGYELGALGRSAVSHLKPMLS